MFLGGTTYQLCQLLRRMAPEKRLYAIDIFSPDFDSSADETGVTMAERYHALLEGRDQRSVCDEVTRSCANL